MGKRNKGRKSPGVIIVGEISQQTIDEIAEALARFLARKHDREEEAQRRKLAAKAANLKNQIVSGADDKKGVPRKKMARAPKCKDA